MPSKKKLKYKDMLKEILKPKTIVPKKPIVVGGGVPQKVIKI